MTGSDSDSFIREVSEEVRQERMFRLWKRYAPAVIGAIFVIVAAAAAWNWMQAQELAAAKARGAAFFGAEETVEGTASVIERLDGPAVAVARLDHAAALAGAGEVEAAVETYRQVAGNTELKRAYTDLAALSAARLEAPQLPLEDAEGLLFPLVDEDGPYRLPALELRAALRMNAGDMAGARDDLRAILSDPGLTGALNRRAQSLLAILGPGAAGEASEAAADAEPAPGEPGGEPGAEPEEPGENADAE